MAFKLQDFRDGQPEPWEYLEASALGACRIGLALTMASGKLTRATGSTKPTYISMYEGQVANGDMIPVIRVHGETRFMTQFSAAATAVHVGDKVTIDATGLLATTTTEGGVLEIVQMRGTNTGDDVIVRIP